MEDKVEALEISLRERKEQSAAEVLGEFLNIEVVSEEDLSNMETETDTTVLQDTSSETGDNPVEAETEASDADDREKLKTTSVVGPQIAIWYGRKRALPHWPTRKKGTPLVVQ